MSMSSISFARDRVSRILSTIHNLKEAEFPYSHSKEALSHFKDLFNEMKDLLDALQENWVNDPATKNVVNLTCSQSQELIRDHLPLLGFILRSTNVRNSFEIHGPLLKLAQKLLKKDTKLLLSSEWDYSPLTYSEIKEMPSFVLLGLPASESSNPLLIPLAGHELGHSLWEEAGIEEVYCSPLVDVAC